MEITLEEIQKKFESLPEDLKWAIMAAKVDDNVIDIGQRENLTVEQMGQLSLETHMVMFGFTPTEKFEESLKASLGLPEDKIRTIAGAVNEKILRGIREKVLRGNREKEADDELLKDEDMGAVPGRPITNAAPEKAEDKIIEDRDELLQKIEKPHLIAGGMHPLLTQKLSVPVQTTPVKTEHTLPNVSNVSSANVSNAAAPLKSAPIVDPYREIPE